MVQNNAPLIYSAPMAGITDQPFRHILRQFSNTPLFTEMIGIKTLYHAHPTTLKMIQIQDETDIIVQLVGIDLKSMAYAAKMAQDKGAIGININMGCPVKKLITNGSGAALMQTPEIAANIVETVKNTVSIPVSVKTRIGWDENHINILDFATTMQNAGADALVIHGRTKSQGYAGTANMNIIKKVKENIVIPVIANGDIIDKKSMDNALAITQANGVMIGRGLLGKPYKLAMLSGIEPTYNLTDIILQHLDLMLSYYGNHGLLVARKHLAWYAKGKKDAATFCQHIFKMHNINQVNAYIKSYFSNQEDA